MRANERFPRRSLKEALEKVEREMITDALSTSRGNMAAAAAALGITERIMGLRVRKYGIDARSFRA
jgi:Nif-specific regulatory protein